MFAKSHTIIYGGVRIQTHAVIQGLLLATMWSSLNQTPTLKAHFSSLWKIIISQDWVVQFLFLLCPPYAQS